MSLQPTFLLSRSRLGRRLKGEDPHSEQEHGEGLHWRMKGEELEVLYWVRLGEDHDPGEYRHCEQ